MQKCEVCGNEYDKPMEISVRGKTHLFDCFECAIHALAPVCRNCGCKIVGHGLEADGSFYCCNHCAEENGVRSLRDRS